MKLFALKHKLNNKSGIIIIIVVWVLVILTTLAISLGRHASLEVAMTKYSIGKVKARSLAWAGLIYAIEQLRLDMEDEESKNIDTLYHCGIRTSLDPQELFQEKELEGGTFSVMYNSESSTEGESADIRYGMRDEAGLINLNVISRSIDGQKTFIELMKSFGVDQEGAQEITHSVNDWIDADDQVTSSSNQSGAEKDYYQSLALPYPCKNSFFDSKEELLLVKGVTTEIYDQIKNYITVFPKDNKFAIHLNTASAVVLKAYAKAKAIQQEGFDDQVIESLVQKMIAFRNGDDQQEFTSDDRSMEEMSKNDLGTSEWSIFQRISQHKSNSEFLRISAVGREAGGGVQSRIEAVVKREDLSIIFWERN